MVTYICCVQAIDDNHLQLTTAAHEAANTGPLAFAPTPATPAEIRLSLDPEPEPEPEPELEPADPEVRVYSSAEIAGWDDESVVEWLRTIDLGGAAETAAMLCVELEGDGRARPSLAD